MTGSSITTCLHAISQGNEAARARLWELVYQELRSVAAGLMTSESSGHVLQPTALVHEAYLRLLGGQAVRQTDRRYFFSAAAQAMRRILIEHARRRDDRAVAFADLSFDEIASDGSVSPDVALDALDEALDALELRHHDAWEVVMHRYFIGLSVDCTAESLGVSTRTVSRLWAFGRAWLYDRMKSLMADNPGGLRE